MVKFSASLFALVSLAASAGVLAHPHGDHETAQELAKRQEFKMHARRALGDCTSQLKARGITDRIVSRREEFAKKSPRPFLGKRDLATILATDHHSNRTDVTTDSDASTVFDSDPICILSPEGEVGPYYVKGELIRSDFTEDQEGVDLYIDVQFIDISTCEPLTGVYVDTWSANATGVYSGVVATGNGVGSDDPSNINATFLRGIQQTNEDGFLQYHTIVPGHYSGRTHHVHIVVHQTDGVAYDNGTYLGGGATHTGQFFFDQSLITQINELSPYNLNNNTLTTNEEDRVLNNEASEDPVLEYVYLGDDLSDGILGWISIGINTTASYEADAASVLTANGGVANSTASSPEGGAPPDGVSGLPSGASAFTVGAAPSASA